MSNTSTLSNLVPDMLSEFSRRLTNWKTNRYFEKGTYAFIEHNRKKWPRRKYNMTDPVILVGLFPTPASIFYYSYFTNFLADKFGGRIESYLFPHKPDPILKAVFESFGARFTLGMDNVQEYALEARSIFQKLKSKWDLLRLSVDDVLIGDKIYDTYLRMYNVAVLDIRDKRLEGLIGQALTIFYAGKRYLEKTNVAAFIMDDPSYINCGIISRLMQAKKVPTYISIWGEEYWVLKIDPQTSGDGPQFPTPATVFPHYAYPEMFARLSPEMQEAGRQKGREAIQKRLAGKHCPLIDMPKSPYANDGDPAIATELILKDAGEKPKILVMLHDFIDSPHEYRYMLFADFYDWICFLLEQAEKTPFRWYVKPHPFATGSSRKVMNQVNRQMIDQLQARFPKITFIPETSSNKQILEEGISALFTVHGTVAHEFAYSGVPVVNAGDNPHIKYDFNLHAKTLEEYAEYIAKADQLKIQIDRAKIEEFIYMNYFYLPEVSSSGVNLIDPSTLTDEDRTQVVANSNIYPKFIASATSDRETKLRAYFRRFFDELEEKQIP